MPDRLDPEFVRLVKRRTELLDLLMTACDRADDFAMELESFSHRAHSRAAVEKMLLEAVAVRAACERVLEQLQRQPAAPAGSGGTAAPATPPAMERKRPGHLRVVGEEGEGPSPAG
jgi:4'-phosphopantetheinyl transferase EntD